MKKLICITIVMLLTIPTFGCNKKQTDEKLHKYETQCIDYFDTVTQIIGYTKSKEKFNDFSEIISSELKNYHELFDIYNDYDNINNIKTINDNAGTKPIVVDKKIIDLLTFSKKQYELTKGTFNIALGSVLSIWHEYRENGLENPDKAELPNLQLLKNANKYTDINKIIIDQKKSTVYLSDKKMRIDVGSVGKGFAVEEICNKLKEKGYNHFVLSVGGNVKTVGTKKENNNWNVGIQNPSNTNNNIVVTSLKDNSLVTSGNYQRYYTVNGKNYHHIIDPSTLVPSSYFSSVSIITKNSCLADILSTAIFNMPLDVGQKYIESLDNTEAMWILKNNDVVYSSNFNKFIKKQI